MAADDVNHPTRSLKGWLPSESSNVQWEGEGERRFCNPCGERKYALKWHVPAGFAPAVPTHTSRRRSGFSSGWWPCARFLQTLVWSASASSLAAASVVDSPVAVHMPRERHNNAEFNSFAWMGCAVGLA